MEAHSDELGRLGTVVKPPWPCSTGLQYFYVLVLAV